MSLINLSPLDIEKLILVFARVMGIIAVIPTLGANRTPNRIKITLGLLVTVLLLPSAKFAGEHENLAQLAGAVLIEVSIGVILGIVVKLVFGAIELAGGFLGFQMGLGIVNVLDPQSNVQVSIISQYYVVIVVLVFFSLDLHHFFFEALSGSFETIPLAAARLSGSMAQFLIELSRQMFVFGVKIAAPVSVALIMVNAVLGLIAKSVPQMNIFMVGFPVTIGVGLLGMGIIMPYMVRFVSTVLFVQMQQDIMSVLMILR